MPTKTKTPSPAKPPEKGAPASKRKKRSGKPRTPPKIQPLEVAQLDHAQLTIPTVAVVIGNSVAHVNRLIAAGKLRATKTGQRCTRVLGAELKRYTASLA